MVGICKTEPLTDKITNNEFHYAQQGQSKPASSNKSISGRAVARTAEYLPLNFEPTVVPSASFVMETTSTTLDNTSLRGRTRLRHGRPPARRLARDRLEVALVLSMSSVNATSIRISGVYPTNNFHWPAKNRASPGVAKANQKCSGDSPAKYGCHCSVLQAL